MTHDLKSIIKSVAPEGLRVGDIVTQRLYRINGGRGNQPERESLLLVSMTGKPGSRARWQTVNIKTGLQREAGFSYMARNLVKRTPETMQRLDAHKARVIATLAFLMADEARLHVKGYALHANGEAGIICRMLQTKVVVCVDAKDWHHWAVDSVTATTREVYEASKTAPKPDAA